MAVLDRSTASLEAPREASPGREALPLLAVSVALFAVLVPLLAFAGGAFLNYFSHH
ncbi:MAG TPA: hypothetical protein VLS49_04920 [Usitatibacter sp.]|nr:hypothetical protein [Usitatibacter sp.]